MNEGQFRAIVERLDRIIESIEMQRPVIIAVPSDANAAEIMEQLASMVNELWGEKVNGAELPKSVPVGPKTKRSRA